MSEAHQTLDLERVRRDLDLLHERICRSWGRIEITSSADGTGLRCVLISKDELETMERALEILCELPGGKQICEGLTRVANVSVRHFADQYDVPRVRFIQGDGDGAGSGVIL
jgi:hypothetical protein